MHAWPVNVRQTFSPTPGERYASCDIGVDMRTTWKPHMRHGDLDTADRDELPDGVYAFPKQRKEPLTDASHVRNALARFDQVKDVSDTDRDLAFANIQKAAQHYGIDVEEKSWRDLGKKPHTPNARKAPK